MTFASGSPSLSRAACTWPVGTAQTRQRSCVRTTSGCSRRRRSVSSTWGLVVGELAPDRVVDLTRRQRAALGRALRETTGFVTASGG